MTIDEFIKENAEALKDKKACVIEHRGYRKQGSFGEQVMSEQRFDADGDPLKRVFIKKMIRGKYVIPYEYAEAGWVEYKPAPIKTIRKKIAESE